MDQQLKLTSPLGRLAGALTTSGANVPQGKRYLTFTQSTEYSTDTIVANPTQPRGDRLVFLTDALADPVRESGTATLTLRVKVDRKTAGFQARVVDYNGNSAFIVSRTIADLGHFKAWDTQKELVPGKWYELSWEINTDDRIFAKGHNLGLVITAEKANPLIGYEPVTATVDTENSWITMPLSGSIASLRAARQLAPILTTTVGPAGASRDVREFVREFFEGSK
jgi:X-Pro dipeptidyl-peptidase